jgi:hypothetical protein
MLSRILVKVALMDGFGLCFYSYKMVRKDSKSAISANLMLIINGRKPSEYA